MSDPLSIAIAGIGGRMGQSVLQAAPEAGFCVTGGTERDGFSRDLHVPVSSDPAKSAENAKIWIDFTTPDATLAALRALAPTTVHAVIIGTTGFTEAQDRAISDQSARYAIVKSGNFSLGVNLLQALVRQAAQALPASHWDIEIFEAHHRDKVDAPSGTALMLGDAAADGRGTALSDLRRDPDNGQTGPRREGSIGFAVRRAGGIYGAHEVMLASGSEVLTLGHTALNRRVFAEGALHAARWAADQRVGLYDMSDVLGL